MLINLTFHDLRHEATSRLAEQFQIHELMKITGHRSTKMLARYYHPRAEDMAKRMRRSS
jgi:integrase